MDVHQLRLLRELDERGSIAAVAAARLVTPSAVSQHLSALQAEFPVPLTERRARRTALTDAGRALVAAGVEVETSFAAARAAVDGFLGDPLGQVKVSAFHSAALAWFPALLERSEAELHLSDGDVSFEEFPQLTLEHDIVIAHRLAHGPDWPRDRVRSVPLLDEPIGVAVAASHPLAGRTSVAPEELVDESWVSVHSGFPLSELLGIIAGAAGRRLRTRYRVNEFFVAAALVRTGRAVALMPRVTMLGAQLDGVSVLELEGLRLARSIEALVQPQALQRRAVGETLDVLRRIAAEGPASG